MNNWQSPDEIFGELFISMHESGIWHDGKYISDLIPLFDPHIIIEEYRKVKDANDFNLKDFVARSFTYKTSVSQEVETFSSVEEHVMNLWDYLQRMPEPEIIGSSLIPLAKRYIVPGGRFNEIYYWDSYFTMLGLKVAGKVDLIEDMIINFQKMIELFGFIPNGNRTYFLSRSQPPFFALMVDLLASEKGDDVYLKYGDTIEKEYHFWMRGVEFLDHSGDAFERVVLLKNKVILNRYFDNKATPRAEMYQDDVALSRATNRNPEELFLNLKAACESGWDFSSRWWNDGENLGDIRTTSIIPVDLNCLMYFYEHLLAKINREDKAKSDWFKKRARKRSRNILKFYNNDLGWYCDIDLESGKTRNQLTLAGMYPLFFKIATKSQAEEMVETLKHEFMAPGGLKTTLHRSGQQWDAPNGWAPLQWMAFIGLKNYGYHELAQEIKLRWLSLNEKVFKNTGKMMEKYNVEDMELASGGGEYPVQDGFGWTNGVYLAMVNAE